MVYKIDLGYATTRELLEELEARLTVRFKGRRGMALGIACRNAMQNLDLEILTYCRAVDEEAPEHDPELHDHLIRLGVFEEDDDG